MRRLVRGLDYYRHTAFEFVTDRLGAQGTVLGGGRYDGLIESLGGAAHAGGRLGGRDRAAGDAGGRADEPSSVSTLRVVADASTCREADVGIAQLRHLSRAGSAAELDVVRGRRDRSVSIKAT